MELWPAMRWRFRAEQDVATYGDGWAVWDEQTLARIPARELMVLEEAVNMSFAAIIRGVHLESTMATLAAMWISLHRAGSTVAWEDFNPAVHLADWEVVPAAPLGSGEDPTPDSPSSEPSPPSEESATSS